MSKNKMDSLLAKIQKDFGENSAVRASEIPPYEVFSSGSLSLDYITGIGGFPTNRVIEIAGEPGVGKTTLALHAVNNRIKMNRERKIDQGAVYIDLEHRITSDWVAQFIDESLIDDLLILWPDTVEEGSDMYRTSIRSGLTSIVVFDSIGGAASEREVGTEEKEKSASTGNFGGNALAVTRLAKLAQTLSGKYGSTFIGINQVRDDMDGYFRLITPGGIAWKHACSLRVELKKGNDKLLDTVDGEKIQVGNTVVAKIHKNSVGAPFKAAWYWFVNQDTENYRQGIDQVDELIRLGITTGVVEKVSSVAYQHPSFKRIKENGRINGKDNVIKAITENEEIKTEIVNDVRAVLLNGGVQGISETFDPEAHTDSTVRQRSVEELLGE